jgi:hypothetical protein
MTTGRDVLNPWPDQNTLAVGGPELQPPSATAELCIARRPRAAPGPDAILVPAMTELRETAFYYPGVIWHDPGWVKSLALFFDEIALLVPNYMAD